jgi:L-fucose isomerase
MSSAVSPPFLEEPYRVGILGFSDGRERVHHTLEPVIERHRRVLSDAISRDPLLALAETGAPAYSSAAARQLARCARADNIEAAVFNIPVFAFPNFGLIAARVLEMPVLVSSPIDGTLPGVGGMLAACGAMSQIGIKCHKLWGDPLADSAVSSRLSAFCRASGAIARLKGSVYGVIGGRSIGMNTGVANTQEWMRRFGIDIEHIDQLELVRRAQLADEAEVSRAYQWLTSNLGQVSTEGKAAPENVRQQIRHAIALRGIIHDFSLDFLSIQCHYDLSEYIVTACVSAMCLNDPYDWNGPKAPVMAACEADSDGALTMQILRLVSGYPSLLFDVRSYDARERVYAFCNCGAQPSWYAARSSDPRENLAQIHLEPVISKYGGGGAHFPYVACAGEVTLARLGRVNGEYRMFLADAEFVDFPRSKMAETAASWPHAYVRMNIEPRDFIDRFYTNHAHVVPGRHAEAVEMYCALMDIPVDRC